MVSQHLLLSPDSGNMVSHLWFMQKTKAPLPEKKKEGASSLIALAASHPFIWLSLEPRPRLFCGRDLREPRQFPSRCDVAKD
ncbi:Cytochrome C Oxidase Assembly Protein Cox15-like [Manis pentadactyla]|nr:Cytochrome C Oxidase Assembly Protein Cox15-like [Manis pentadactyla]